MPERGQQSDIQQPVGERAFLSRLVAPTPGLIPQALKSTSQQQVSEKVRLLAAAEQNGIATFSSEHYVDVVLRKQLVAQPIPARVDHPPGRLAEKATCHFSERPRRIVVDRMPRHGVAL